MLFRSRPAPLLAVVAVLAATGVLAGACTSGSPSPSGSSSGSSSGRSSAPSSGPSAGPSSSGGATPAAAPACDGPGRTVTAPLRAAVTGAQWQVPSPPDDVTYDLSGVTSTAYPSGRSPFALGGTKPGLRTCIVGGTIRGAADDKQTWDYYHGKYNAACVTIIGREWMQVRGLRCDDVEDGIRPEESTGNANDSSVYVSGTYLTRIRDDCIENDFTVGGLLQDNLWEQCNTGVSERPSGSKSWSTPQSETLTLDHMLIGLYQTPHEKDGTTVMGENGLFKWSSSGNHVVIKCSIFEVDALSLNGKDAMALPPGTVVDDSACPGSPSTIVWLGKGAYPADPGGLKVVTDPAVWTGAVRAWKAAHGFS